MTLSERIRRTLASGDAQAFETEAGWTSWPQVAAVAQAVNDAMAALRLDTGAPVGLIGRNRLWSAGAFLAILAGERCTVPINPFQSEDKLLGDIANLGLGAVIGEPEDFASGALETLARRNGIGAIVLAGPRAGDVQLVVERGNGAVRDMADCVLLIPTSGTTGAPKRVPIRAAALAAANVEADVIAREYGELDGPGSEISPLIQYSPLVHITGALGVSRCGSEGRRLVLLEKFTPEAWAEAIFRNRVRIAGLPPTMMRMVLTYDPPPEKLASLVGVWSGSSPVDMAVVKIFEARYGVTVMGNYGATEYCGTVASGSMSDRTRFGDAKDGAVGRFRRNVADLRILDPDTGETVSPGSVGVLELQVRRMGPEWMRTSDLASLDADDFLYIHGRADDAIIRGGFKIVPSVIIEALKRHPDVNDVAVVGLPDARLGAAPAAVVEARPGRPAPTSEALMLFARKELVAYQAPTEIRVVAALPRTPSFKIDKAAVRALF